MNRKFARTPIAQNIFSNLFGGGSGSGTGSPGIVHNPGGRVQATPTVNPQQQLTAAPPAPAPAATPAAPAPSPMDSQLEKLRATWNTQTTADGKPVAAPADPLYQPLFQVKGEDVAKAANGLDFTTGIQPELAQKALGGDMEAFKECLNSVARAAFTGVTINSGNLMNDGFSRHSQAIDAALPTRFRNHEIINSKPENPILSDPGMAPMVASVKAVLARNNPGMSAEQVNARAEEYFSTFATAMNMQNQQVEESKKPKDTTDWLAFSGMGQS